MADNKDKKSPRVIDDIIRAGQRGVASVAIVAGSAGLTVTPSTASAQQGQDIATQILNQIPNRFNNDKLRQEAAERARERAGVITIPLPPSRSGSAPQAQGNEPARNEQNKLENSVTAYSFKTPMTESLGNADVTMGVAYVSETDKRFTPAARAAYEDVLNSITLLKNGVIPDGIKKFNANKSLTAQERAQVIGSTVAMLRADAAITSNDQLGLQQTQQDIDKRTIEGGKMVALFVRAVPDAKNIHYTWTAPDNPFVKKPTLEALGSADIRTRGKTMSGNLGAFLASGFQDNRPNSEKDALNPTYRLYDELMRPTVLKFVDSQISQPFPSQAR